MTEPTDPPPTAPLVKHIIRGGGGGTRPTTPVGRLRGNVIANQQEVAAWWPYGPLLGLPADRPERLAQVSYLRHGESGTEFNAQVGAYYHDGSADLASDDIVAFRAKGGVSVGALRFDQQPPFLTGTPLTVRRQPARLSIVDRGEEPPNSISIVWFEPLPDGSVVRWMIRADPNQWPPDELAALAQTVVELG